MCPPHRGHGDHRCEPGEADGQLGIGDGPVAQGAHWHHHCQEPEKVDNCDVRIHREGL